METLKLEAAEARIGRDLAETRKFVAEQAKLSAGALKLRRDRFLAPFVIVAATVTGLTAGIGATIGPVITRALMTGHHP